ncbi:DUF3300 domain-containing protein [Rugamonas sp. A1-17]|nr:DUF3300 domain-containing protein [Rugamonas sp. A1-17]
MTIHTKNLSSVVTSSLLLGMLTLAGCDKPAAPPPQTNAAADAPAQPAPYTPPTAEQLSQMVAPIALFPDKLVAQVLAGATYPDQIAAANQWLGQNPSLKGAALQTAESGQPWDVSVKSLTAFPNVLGQMAGNIQWTTALGEAYVNDPNDVMNAIQQMRLRAQQSGNLRTSPHLKVATVARPAPPPAYEPPPSGEPVVYQGPPVIHTPPHIIVIEPAEPDVVYVPRYNPEVVYGAPVRVYPGWTDRQPAYVADNTIATGAITFGIGVLVGAAVSHHDGWGWNSWGVNWGGPPRDAGPAPGWERPAVVYNNATYVSKSVTVVNRVNNVNIVNNNYRTANNYRTINNYQTTNNAATAVSPAQVGRPVAAIPPSTPMSMPRFSAHDSLPGAHVRPPLAPQAQAMHAAPAPQVNRTAAPPEAKPPVVAPVRLAHEEHLSGASAPHASQPAPAPVHMAAAPLPKPEPGAVQHAPPHIAHQEAPPVHEHAAERAPVPRPDRHAANTHPPEKHDKHDKHDGEVRHG